MDKIISRIFWIFILISGILAGTGLLIIQYGSSILLMPMKISEDVVRLPSGLEISKVDAEVAGEKLDVRYYKNRDSGFVILFFHSGIGNMYDRTDMFDWCQATGFSLIMFDYRGFGLSEGETVSEQSLTEDSIRMSAMASSLSWPKERTLIYGEGATGSFAASIAGKNNRCAGLILENAVPSLGSIMRDPVRRQLLKGHFNLTEIVPSVNIPVLYLSDIRHSYFSDPNLRSMVSITPLCEECRLEGQPGKPVRLAAVESWTDCILDFVGKISKYQETREF